MSEPDSISQPGAVSAPGAASDLRAIAQRMLGECLDVGQSSVRVSSPKDAGFLRKVLRRLAREAQIKIRTAALEPDVVAIARLDSAIWNDDVPTMRAKLSPTNGANS